MERRIDYRLTMSSGFDCFDTRVYFAAVFDARKKLLAAPLLVTKDITFRQMTDVDDGHFGRLTLLSRR